MTKSTQYSAVNLISEAGVDPGKWNILPTPDIVKRTAEAVEARGIRVMLAENGDEALALLKDLIPPGSEVMNGSSTTLIEIGYMELLESGMSGWRDLHAVITSEDDAEKRAELRRKAVGAEYFISGTNAIAQTGEMVSCDASGSRVGAWPFAAGKLIIVAGINKIVPSLPDAMLRVWEYSYKLEDARVRRAQGTSSMIGKCVILFHEKNPGRVMLILVEEALGY
jgi:L-lactate utilization protein LutB